jgi:hypothetical protein
VDTKFFERNRAILDALLLQVQPEAVDQSALRFEARHGLRWEEPLVRLRFLDPALQDAHGFTVADLAVPAPTFRSLALGSVNAIITENLRNFLAVPALPNAVAVLGSGDAAALLTKARWLAESRILYWGDLDVRGYAILARLRAEYPATESVLMDDVALDTHRSWATPTTPSNATISGLSPGEARALERVCSEGLWLEQERIPFTAVQETLTGLVPPRSTSNAGSTSEEEL